MYRRRLPHIQGDGKALFVTFSTFGRWVLPEVVRGRVLGHCVHDHRVKYWLHGAVVMPDHVHLVFTPLVDEDLKPFTLKEILGGIKGASAHTVNRLLKRKGHLWQDESFDHVLRLYESARSKVEYVCQNPVRKGLVQSEDEYPWLWREWLDDTDEPCGL